MARPLRSATLVGVALAALSLSACEKGGERTASADRPTPTAPELATPTSITAPAGSLTAPASVPASPVSAPTSVSVPDSSKPTGSVSVPDATRPTGSVSIPTISTLPPGPRDGHAEGDPGTVSLSITSPFALAGWAPVPVQCAVSGRKYTASFEGAVVAVGVTASASITAAPYPGKPGTYPGVGSLTIGLPDGTSQTLPLAAEVSIAADLAGSVSFDVTAEGVTVAGAMTWHCSA